MADLAKDERSRLGVGWSHQASYLITTLSRSRFGGGYFMWCYLRCYRATHRPYEAMMESTRAHATYNAEIVVVLLLAFVTLAITGG